MPSEDDPDWFPGEPGQRSEQGRLLREDTAEALHRRAAKMAPHPLGPENSPVITGYASTTFRSQLEARWAAYFDQRGIAWRYEPDRLSGWTHDFRLVLNDVEAYAEVKPVSEFPMDVAQRVLEAPLGRATSSSWAWSRATPGDTGATGGARWAWPYESRRPQRWPSPA